jgi:ABC-type multidrug transport system fused ATPase/permease subunit
MLLLVAGTGVELLLPWPVKWLVDGVFGTQSPPPWLVRLWPPFGGDQLGGAVMGVVVGILVLAVLQQAFATASQLLLVRSGWRIVLGLRSRVMDHLHRLSLTYHDRTKVGESLYRIAYDTQAAQTVLSQGISPLVIAVVLLPGILGVMWWLDAGLAVAVMSFAPLFALTVHGFGLQIGARARAYHERESALVALVQETLSSIRAVKAFTLEPWTAGRFGDEARRSMRESERLALYQLLFAASVGLLMAAGTAVVVWLGAARVARGSLYLGDVLVFLAYLGMLYRPVSSISSAVAALRTGSSQLRRVFELLDTTPEVRDRPGARRLSAVAGLVELDAVSYAYEPGRLVLRDVTLRVEPGQVVALAGRTGAGKTTLAALLVRFCDPVSGAVRLDGVDLRDLELTWLRQQVAVVLQDPILFSGTVRENIAYGRPGAGQDAIEDAARRAQAHEFIASLPQGYDTEIGERGVSLSGGQRQRLAIARAFLKNAPILVLDEPTSALDPETELAVLDAVHGLVRGRTTFIIAHRLAMVRHADTIVLLDQGRIVEQGSHQALLERSEAYRRLYAQEPTTLAGGAR